MIRFGSEGSWQGLGRRCGDCGVARGGLHHLGCDIQRCPVCGRQMFTCGCRFDEVQLDIVVGFDGLGPDVDAEPLHVDRDGILVERRNVGGQDLIIHYDDIPESDITVLDGIRVTTALRTVIDIAADVEPDHLERIVDDVLGRRLFTLDEAHERLAQPDMATRSGAILLRELLARRAS
jgi:hypothetical protein